jgi:transcription initiation factor IIF auxiliary subunit
VPEALLTGAPSAMAMDVSAPLLQLRQTHEPTRDGQHRWSLSLETVEGHADALQCVKSVSFNLHPTFTPSVYDVRQPPFRVGPFIGWGTFNVKVVVDMGPDTPEICTKFPLTFECSEKVLPVATAA